MTPKGELARDITEMLSHRSRIRRKRLRDEKDRACDEDAPRVLGVRHITCSLHAALREGNQFYRIVRERVKAPCHSVHIRRSRTGSNH